MTIKVFVSGQSNALGRGTGGPDWSLISADVTVWNNVNPLGGNGSAFVSAATARAGGTFENTDRNNFGVWFCDWVTRAYFEPVTMTIVARGASPIAYWSPDEVTYPMLQECIDVWAATGQEPADVFLWHQGEGNVTTSHYEYFNDFLALLDNLKAGGVIDNRTKVILGGLTESIPSKTLFNDDVLMSCAAACSGAYAPSSNLANDGTHFTGPGLYQFSTRYYSCYRYLEGL